MIKRLKRIYSSIKFQLWLCLEVGKLMANCETVSIRVVDSNETVVHFFKGEITKLGLVDLQELLDDIPNDKVGYLQDQN